MKLSYVTLNHHRNFSMVISHTNAPLRNKQVGFWWSLPPAWVSREVTDHSEVGSSCVSSRVEPLTIYEAAIVHSIS
jgi:hypothetical protein